MGYQRQAFGSAGRVTTTPGGPAQAPLVGILARDVTTTGGLIDSGVVGMLIPGNPSGFPNEPIDPNVAGANARWMATAALAYGTEMDDLESIAQIRQGGDNADDIATHARGALLVLSRQTLFDGTTWDRSRAATAAALAAFTTAGAAIVSDPGQWSINHTPAAATQATVTRAAGGAGVRHVATSISAYLIIQPTINQPVITVNLRDGGTGAGTILWSRNIGIGAALANGGEQSVELSGLKIVGSANTAMTLEFSAAGVAGTIQSVALTGHDAS